MAKAQIKEGQGRRADPEISRVFVAWSENADIKADSFLPVSKLESALHELKIFKKREELEEYFRTAELKHEGFLSLNDFKMAVQSLSRSPMEAWAQTLPLATLLTDALPVVEGCDQLDVLTTLTRSEATDVIDGFCEVLKEVFQHHVEELRKARKQWDGQRRESMLPGSKFEIVKMSCGTIEDFHGGVQKRIGASYVDSEPEIAMKNEHCSKVGCDFQFTTTNYNITTTPQAEWGVVVAGTTVAPEAMKKRRIPILDNLEKLEITRRSKLIREEIIALVLYSGPLYLIYNVILRKGPLEIYEHFNAEKDKNLFSTTIFVLASAVQKISRVMKLREGMRLYRGLGGTTDFPDTFFKPDECGRTGFAEWGFMSATENRDIAVQYCGINEKKPLPFILEIRVGAVDRGACIQEYSQYPEEVEYIFVPCSFLERDGAQRFEFCNARVVSIVPVKVNANLKALTVEELVGQKKSMHIAAFSYLIDEIRQELFKKVAQCKERLVLDTSQEDATVAGFLERIIEQCSEVRARHEAVSPAEYVKYRKFRSLVIEMADVKIMAMSKLDEWLENKSSSLIRFRWNAPLRTVHRRWILFLQKNLIQHDLDKIENTKGNSQALRLCQGQGLIAEGVDEKNELYETRLISAAAEGKSAKDLQLLVAAGSSVREERPDGVTAVWLAAQFGHTECLSALVKMNADVKKAANDQATPLYIAAQNGNVDCVEILVHHRADVDACDKAGLTPMHQAAMNGHHDCVRRLIELNAHISPLDLQGRTPIDLAQSGKHQRCVDILSSGDPHVDSKSLASMSGNKNLIISTGDISDVDGFMALAEYAKTGSDVLFIMNYPAYIGVSDADNDDLFASFNPGLGFKYSATAVLDKVTPGKEAHYDQFIGRYGGQSDGDKMKSALTDLAFAMANGVFSEATKGGKLLFCIGGINAINPFSAKAIKNEVVVYSKVVQPKGKPLPAKEGTIYDSSGTSCALNWNDYSSVYMDFNGSMAFWNEYWGRTFTDIASKIKGAFIMGGVYNDRMPVSMPSIPGVLNRFASATMNQLYHPQNTAEFFAFLAQNKIPSFTITNNAVHDLTVSEQDTKDTTYSCIEKFLSSNGLDGKFLKELAYEHYNSQHNPPKKAFDFYTALVLKMMMHAAKESDRTLLQNNRKTLFYSNVYGTTFVSSSVDWDTTLAEYSKSVNPVVKDDDELFEKNKKENFQKEIAIMKSIRVLSSLPVFDVHFVFDPDSKRLQVDLAPIMN